jgi:hypothetical protein
LASSKFLENYFEKGMGRKKKLSEVCLWVRIFSLHEEPAAGTNKLIGHGSNGSRGKLRCKVRNCAIASVSDPDWILIRWLTGSGSGFGLWIRIQEILKKLKRRGKAQPKTDS